MRKSESIDLRAKRFGESFAAVTPIISMALRKRFGGSRDEVLDTISETHLALLERVHSSAQPLPFESLEGREFIAYMMVAAANRYRDRIRHQQVIKRSERELILVLESGSSPEAELAHREERGRLRQAVAELRSPYRELFEALLAKDITLAEFARQEGVKSATIYQRFRRGLSLLRDSWQS